MSTTSYQIIAVDFDGTLCFSNWPELGEPNRPLIEYLLNQKRYGNKLILWLDSNRSGGKETRSYNSERIPVEKSACVDCN